ncbi:TetR/AcrR family transcriptional regulator [Nocardia sp. NPDC052566]|uniref:TetR/AcrR family transcriptional regulator n=1 Tax=Nocardia sp. NPDC052566 TaxID=3364330 RepID=UPI0037CC23C5
MDSGIDPGDLTGRARIRDAAVRHFGEYGFDKATIRGIAESAGVAASLVRHHFGSKEGLRDACDEHLITMLRRLNAEVWKSGVDAAGDVRPGPALGPYQRYLARALVEGRAGAVFDEIVTMHEQWLAATEDPAEPLLGDRRARATVRTAMALSMAVLSEHVARNLGEDPTSRAGESRLLRALLDVQSRPQLTTEQAAAAAAALGPTSD